MTLLRITAPHFCASIEVGSDWCAPIIYYMRDWPLSRITAYCWGKGWKIEKLEEGCGLDIDLTRWKMAQYDALPRDIRDREKERN